VPAQEFDFEAGQNSIPVANPNFRRAEALIKPGGSDAL
jgi:hypothetical protein